MAKDVTMPLLSPSMTEGTLVKWLKKEGDAVKTGEVIAEVETDKATMDLEAFDDGILLKVIAQAGAKVPVNARIALIGAKGEKVDEAALAAPAPAAAPEKKAEAPTPAPAPAAATNGSAAHAPAVSSPNRVKASPLAKKVAQELGVALSQLTGTGPGGRIVKKDVLSGPRGGGSGGWGLYPSGPIAKEEKLPLSNMRQTIARRLLESKTTIPHFYLEIEADAAPLVALRATLNAGLERAAGKEGKPLKLSLNDFVLKATAEAIRRVPAINASFLGDSVQQYGSVRLAFAVAIAQGLITPVIADAQDKSLKAISEEAKALAAKAKDGKLKPEEYTTGTFTVSNLGMYGIDRFSAIVNPPQAGILAVGNVVKKPVVDKDDRIVVGHRQSFTLSCDHRVVDGAVGAQFLQELRTLIENPALLLI